MFKLHFAETQVYTVEMFPSTVFRKFFKLKYFSSYGNIFIRNFYT